ncbi:MAG: hypothetical protein R3D25_21545 [Geminicoccaceae bacterium]
MLLALLLGLAPLLAPGNAVAADECSLANMENRVAARPDEAASWLADAQRADCFGVEAEPFCATGGPTDTVCLHVRDWALSYQKSEPDLLALCQQTAGLTAELAAIAGALPERPDVAITRDRLAAWRIDCGQEAGMALAANRASEWEVRSGLAFFGGSDRVEPIPSVNSACPADAAGPALDECLATTRTYFILLGIVGLQHDINSRLLGDNLRATVQYVADLDARWEQYFSRGRSLLPWEVAVNGWLARPERGFNEPPTFQIALLHPGPIVTTSGFSHDSMAAGIALDLVGIYAWRWDGTRMRSPFDLPGSFGDMPLGGAITLVVDGNDDPGLGLVAYLPRNWSLGAAVKTDGDFRLLLSVDLAKLMIDPESQRERLTAAFRAN